MNRIEAIAVLLVVLIASWVVATALPAWSEVAWAGGVLAMLAIVLAGLIARAAAMRHRRLTAFQALLTRSDSAPARPADLERIERLAGWVAYSEHDFSHRLKPLIVALICRRLQISRGIEVADGASPPSDLLSDELAELIAPTAGQRLTPITTGDLNRALDEIETL
jgi:hypothetical protein